MVIERNWVHISLRVIVGVVFCVSAVAKLVAIDDFELYVYSYGWLPLGMSYVAARLCIGWELVLGLSLIVGWWRRPVRTMSLLTVLFFSLVLCYALLTGNDEPCECMGRLVRMNPSASLVKNGVLVLFLLGSRERRVVNGERRVKKWKVAVTAILAAVLMALPFLISVPDSWGFGPHREVLGEEALREATEPGGVLEEMGIGSEKRLVAFVTPQCPYCRLARKKLEGMERRLNLEQGSVVFVEPGDIGDSLFVAITYGNRPLMLLMEGQEVRATYHLRNVDEGEVEEFFESRNKK